MRGQIVEGLNRNSLFISFPNGNKSLYIDFPKRGEE